MVLKLCLIATIVATFANTGMSKASLLPDCPIYWTAFGDNCYRYFGQRVNLKEARYNCRSHARADRFAHLVSIHSQEENDYVATLFKSYTEDSEQSNWHLWIGLNDEAEEGKFVWSDGTSSNFTNWGNQQPQGNRSEQGTVLIHPKSNQYGLWHDISVTSLQRYICKMPRYNK